MPLLSRAAAEVAVFERGEKLASFDAGAALHENSLTGAVILGEMAAWASGVRVASAVICSEMLPCSGCAAWT